MSKKQKKELTLEQDDLSLGLKDVPFPDVIKFVTTPASKVPSLVCINTNSINIVHYCHNSCRRYAGG